jgi:N-acylneuraminate cytidylyltransferase
MKNHSGVVALIPARGGSKGVPRKNIRELAGKPLIAYAIETALDSDLIDRVVVSTEDEEIANIARFWGAEVPFMRPVDLAQDDSSEWLTWQHTIRSLNDAEDGFNVELLVCVSPTSPLRSVEDVDSCIRALRECDADLVISVKNADRNPYYNMVALDANGYAALAISGAEKLHRRQDAPNLFDITTVAYAARPEYVMRANRIFDGNVKTINVPAERAVDIDTELDFAFAEFLITRLGEQEQDGLQNK